MKYHGTPLSSTQLNAYHGDEDPCFRAGFGGFVIACQAAVVHEPAEGALHDPASWQHFKTRGGVRAFDDLDRQFGAEFFDPVGERRAGVTTIHPQQAQPSEPS